MAWLYRYEAKGIQSYILATQKLREMIGASALVEALGVEAKRRAAEAGGSPIMAAAGSATIEFPDNASLRAFAAGWPMWVSRHSPGLQMVQAWASLDGRSYDAALREVLAGLEAARNRPPVELPEAGPLVARAGRTGRPAVRRGKADGLQDAATAAKDAAAVAKGGDSANDQLKVRLGLERESLALDMDGFGEGYVAVVHLDGNGVGRRIVERIASRPRPQQQAFCEKLAGATEAAARRAAGDLVARLRAERGAKDNLPFRPLVLGGDDFTAILRAENAIDFVRTYLTAFEHETAAAREALEGGLTACAGVAFVKRGFPFHAAHGLAEELCRRAKSGLAAADGPRSGLAFYRVTAALVDSLDAALASELAVAGDPAASGADAGFRSRPRPGGLFGGPWLLADLDKLHELVAATRAMPRGALREWLRLVQIDRGRAAAHWQRTLEVLQRRAPADRKKLEAALQAVGARGEDGFRPDGTTPLLDATTLAGLAPKSPSSAGPTRRNAP
jgi:hypothetical protein